VVRFCLECSQATGRLVPRVAPALEKARAAKGELRKAKAAKARDRAKAKAQAWPNVLFKIFEDVKQLRCWKKEVKHATLKLRKSKTRQNSRGFATWGGKCSVTVGRDVGCTIETLVHEVCHVAFFERHGTHGSHKELHDDRFHSMLIEASRLLLGEKYFAGIGERIAKMKRDTKYNLDWHVLNPIYREAVKDGVFGDLPSIVEIKLPHKREVPFGKVSFSISGYIWVACDYDNGDDFGGAAPGIQEALKTAKSARTGKKGSTHKLCTDIETALAIAADIESHAISDDWRTLDRCADQIRHRANLATHRGRPVVNMLAAMGRLG